MLTTQVVHHQTWTVVGDESEDHFTLRCVANRPRVAVRGTNFFRVGIERLQEYNLEPIQGYNKTMYVEGKQDRRCTGNE